MGDELASAVARLNEAVANRGRVGDVHLTRTELKEAGKAAATALMGELESFLIKDPSRERFHHKYLQFGLVRGTRTFVFVSRVGTRLVALGGRPDDELDWDKVRAAGYDLPQLVDYEQFQKDLPELLEFYFGEQPVPEPATSHLH